MDLWWLFLVFLRGSLLSLGGQTALPLLRQDLVTTGILTDAQVIEGLTIGRLSTGPGGLYIVALGYLSGAWMGAAVALVAITLPPMLIVPASAYLRPRLHRRRINGMIRGLALATSGLVVSTSVQILMPSFQNEDGWWQVLLLSVGLIAGVHGKIHPVIPVVVGALVGLVLS